MSATAAILAGIATKIGAPIVKGLLEQFIGGKGAAIGGTIIDAIAGKAGVPADELASVPEAQLEQAVRQVERETPELILAWNEQQRQAHDLMRAEMEAGPFWSWAWRPGGMYLLGFFWLLYVLIYPSLNLFLRLFGSSASLETLVDVATLMTVSGGFITLYMGGYTALRGIEKWKGQ